MTKRFRQKCAPEPTLLLGPLLFFLLGSSVIHDATALDPTSDPDHYVYTSWALKEGMPQATVQAILQSRDGYLWLGTQAGLVRYNGLNFKVFNRNNTEGLSSSNVNNLLQADDDTIWISAEASLSKYKDGQIKSYGPENGLSGAEIRSIALDGEGQMWITDNSQSVMLFIGSSAQTLFVDPSLPDLRVIKVAVTDDGSVWLGTNHGVYLYRDGRFENFTTEHGLPHNTVHVVYRDSDGALMVGTEKGCAKFVGGSFQIPTEVEQLKGKAVEKLLRDRDGNLWVAVIGQGIFILQKGAVKKLGRVMLDVKLIRGFYEDREGSIWVGTDSKSLVQVYDSKLKLFAPNPAPLTNMTWSIYEDRDGTIWMGTANGMARYDHRGMIRYDEKDGLKNTGVFAFFETRRGDFWIGTNGDGPAKFSNGRFQFLSRVIPELGGTKIRAILEDGQGRLWFGTRNSGMYVVQGNRLIEHFHAQNGLRSNRVTGLIAQPDGSILISTGVGLTVYRNGGFSNPFPDIGYRVYGPSFDRQGNLWFGSIERGVHVYRNGKLHVFDHQVGLPDNSAWGLSEDSQGFAWVPCNSGVYRVSKQDLLDIADGKKEKVDVKLFGRPDGLPNPECNGGAQYSTIIDRNQQLWFTCLDGAVVFDPQKLGHNELPPPVYVEQMTAAGEIIPPGHQFEHGDRRYEFQFAALSYVSPEDMTLKYQLVGYDPDWIDVTDSRNASYTNLAPGEYAFKVIAANSDGIWNKEGARFSFEIEAPYYFKPWFWILVTLLFIGFVGGIIFTWVHIARKRTIALSELAWRQTRDVLEGQVDAIRSLIADASGVSTDMQSLMGQLATSSEQVAAAVTETGATVEELERTGKAAESNARRIVDAVKKTEEESVRGRDSVDRSAMVMNEIRSDSVTIAKKSKELLGRIAQVDRIAAMVGEISEASAVLSINAAIEASKAGQFGDGFGVVAENMQELAQRSKNSTVEIMEILSSTTRAIDEIAGIATQGQVRMDQGVSTIQQSGQIVRALSDEVAENSNLAQIIAKSIEQQITGLHYIGSAVAEFTGTVDNNKKISQSVATGAHRLGKSIDRLLETIENWKTPDFYK